MNKKYKTITIKLIGEHFKKSSREINKIFEELKWIEKKEKWWILTPTGKNIGGKELYNPKNKTKYTIWQNTILNNNELINKINQKYKSTKNKSMSQKAKKDKGDLYEKFISEHFRTKGYTIAEHGKDNGVKDKGIDIIAKKKKEILFIQCKNWSAKGSRKIKSDDMKITRQNIQDYKKNNPLYDLYDMKILYIMSENVLHGSAYHYIQEHNEIIDFRIIPIIN